MKWWISLWGHEQENGKRRRRNTIDRLFLLLLLLLRRELLLFFVPLIFRRETVLFSVWSIKRGGRDPIRPNYFSAVGPTTVLLVFPPSASSLSRRQNCLPLSIHVIKCAVDVRGETLRKTVYFGLLKIATVLTKGESFEKPDCVAINEFFGLQASHRSRCCIPGEATLLLFLPQMTRQNSWGLTPSAERIITIKTFFMKTRFLGSHFGSEQFCEGWGGVAKAGQENLIFPFSSFAMGFPPCTHIFCKENGDFDFWIPFSHFFPITQTFFWELEGNIFLTSFFPPLHPFSSQGKLWNRGEKEKHPRLASFYAFEISFPWTSCQISPCSAGGGGVEKGGQVYVPHLAFPKVFF